MKTAVFTILGIVIGIVVGAGGMHQWLMPQLLELDYKLGESERTLAALPSERGDGIRLARLEKERQDYEQHLSKLRSEIESLKNTVEAAPPSAEAIPTEAPLNALPEASTSEHLERDRRGARRKNRGTTEEREERRQAFVAQLQENLTDFFTGELEKPISPEAQERLIALETQVQEMMDLRRQIRDVNTDEERDALRQTFGETMNTARGIMKEQQRDMINAIAGQFNITRTADRAAFRKAVQSAVESPFFRDNPASLFWSAGRRGDHSGPRRRP